jgi:hypothetical protein
VWGSPGRFVKRPGPAAERASAVVFVVARSFDRCAQSVVVKGAKSKTMGRIFFESAGMFSLWGRWPVGGAWRPRAGARTV